MKTREEELFSCLVLKEIKGVGPATIKKIVAEQKTFSHSLSFLQKELLAKEQTVTSPKDLESCFKQAEKQVELILKKNISFLLLTDDNYPELLKEISTPPPVLFFKGNKSLLIKPKVAIVGSRKCSVYGLKMAEEIASYLASKGLCIVSGLALGIDAKAQQSALLKPGKSIGVLGCGIDVIYPYQNKKLFEQMEREGLLLTEFLPSTKPEAKNFPLRNRLISGLSLGVVVIEAYAKSGSLITAQFALEQNREVLAVPGTSKMPSFAGCNKLIQEGAYLVQSPEDVLRALSLDIGEELEANKNKPEVKLSSEENLIVHLLEQKEEMHIEELHSRLQFSSATLNSLLLQLEVKGLIIRKPGMFYSKA